MTDWIEISLQVDGEAAEAVAEVLQRYGHQGGVLIEHEGIPADTWDEDEVPEPEKLNVRAYFADDDTFDEIKQKIETVLGLMSQVYPIPTPIYSKIKDQDWNAAWKANYKPVRIGKHILIHPQWIEVQPNENDIVIAIDPGMAFGTGTHPTTQLCLEAIEDLAQPGLKMLDLGCGSGILSIAAAKLGISSILALDIDNIAVDTTITNAEINGTAEAITAQTGSLESLIASPRRFDFVVVNILAKIIMKMCENHLGDVVRPGGTAIFSGILEEQREDMIAALRSTGLEPTGFRTQGDWVLIETRRPD